MKIVFIGCRSLKLVGGIESYMLDLCSTLAKKGHRIVLYVGSDNDKTEELNGFQIKNVKVTKNKFLNKISIGFKSTLRALKVDYESDIFHYNANIAGLFSFMPLLFGKKVVFQGHGFEWKRKKWNCFVRFACKLVDNFVLSINKNIFMCSEEQCDYVRKYYRNKNVFFTPGGVNYPPVMPEMDVYKDKKYILFLGRIVAEKRVDLLLKAYSEVKAQIEEELYIAGPVENENIVKAFRNEERIHFLGPKMGNEKASLLKNASVFVLPSDLEGLSVSVLEAMNYGNICLVSDIQANKEALGEAGLYFKAGNYEELKQKLLMICNSKDFSVEYRQLAVNRIKSNFDWTVLAERMLNYYKSLN